MGMPVLDRIYSGDIVTVPFQVLDEDGDPLDLTGASELVVKLFTIGTDGFPSGAALLSDNLAGDVDIDDAANGEASVDYAAADTASLAGRYWLEAKLTDAAGAVRTIQPAILPIVADLITS